MDPELTVEQAKADTQRLEREVAAAFPAEIVDRIEQPETGTLLPCDGNGTWSWSGRTKVYFKTPATSDQLLRDVAAQFETAEFRVVQGNGESKVYGPEGQSVMASYADDGAYASIVSGSACFVLPDDQYPGDEF